MSDKILLPASWLSVNAFVSEAEGLRFKSQAGQTAHNVANASPRCNISPKGAVLPGRNDLEMGSANSSYTLRRVTACIM